MPMGFGQTFLLIILNRFSHFYTSKSISNLLQHIYFNLINLNPLKLLNFSVFSEYNVAEQLLMNLVTKLS